MILHRSTLLRSSVSEPPLTDSTVFQSSRKNDRRNNVSKYRESRTEKLEPLPESKFEFHFLRVTRRKFYFYQNICSSMRKSSVQFLEPRRAKFLENCSIGWSKSVRQWYDYRTTRKEVKLVFPLTELQSASLKTSDRRYGGTTNSGN